MKKEKSHMIQSISHGGVSVMAWACAAASGVTNDVAPNKSI